MTKLAKQQMIQVIKEGTINKLSKEEKNQVLQFAFGSTYMESSDKGSKKVYVS